VVAPDVTTPETDKRVALAPELAAVVNGAIEEMDQMIQRGRLQNDPLRFPIAAEQAFLRAFYQVALDLLHKITTQQAASLPVPGRAAIDTTNAGAARIPRTSRRPGWRTALRVAAGLAVALGIGAVGGWWWRGSVLTVISGNVTAQNCEHKPDGSVLCSIQYRQAAPSSVSQ
jgi:hypothetical protein